MKAIIVDVDGTIADCDHRKVHLPNWPKFFELMGLDKPIEPVIDVVRSLYFSKENYQILIVTARPNEYEYRHKTMNWLAQNYVPYHQLYMRKAGDYRQDSIVKKEILQQIIDDGYEPYLAIDDRAQVVKMWREYGIRTLQVAADEDFGGKPSKYEGQCLFHMMVGPSGAGKSTYIELNYKPRDVVSTDEIRRQLFGSHELGHNPEDLARTWSYAKGWIRTRLENGIFTVLDATNIKRKDRLGVLECVPRGQLATYVVINRQYNDKLRDRGWRPEELILKHDTTFRSNLKDILNADNQGNVIVLDKREWK